MANEPLDYIVWIKERGTWRVLACYATLGEAIDCEERNREDGETVRFVVRGDKRDEAMRRDVHCR